MCDHKPTITLKMLREFCNGAASLPEDTLVVVLSGEDATPNVHRIVAYGHCTNGTLGFFIEPVQDGEGLVGGESPKVN